MRKYFINTIVSYLIHQGRTRTNLSLLAALQCLCRYPAALRRGSSIAAFCLCFMLGVSYAGNSDYTGDGNIKAELVWSEWDDEIETDIVTESVSSDDLDLDSVQVLRQDSNVKYYLAFGDSITRGVIRSDGTMAEGYPVELEDLINEKL